MVREVIKRRQPCRGVLPTIPITKAGEGAEDRASAFSPSSGVTAFFATISSICLAEEGKPEIIPDSTTGRRASETATLFHSLVLARARLTLLIMEDPDMTRVRTIMGKRVARTTFLRARRARVTLSSFPCGKKRNKREAKT